MMFPYLRSHFPRIAFWLFLGLIALAAVWTLLAATPAGVGLANDSAAYIGGARGLLDGRGYSDVWLDSALEPITHYPPFYSLTLAVVGKLAGLDPIRAARLVQVILWGMNAFLIGLFGWRMTKSQVAGGILAALFAANGALLRIHAVALSEGLFIFWTLVSFLLFDTYHRNGSGMPPGAGRWFNFFDEKRPQKRLLLLALAGCAVGFSYLTRYTGLAVLATLMVAAFLLQDAWKQRFRDAGIVLAGALPWMAAWHIRNLVLAGNATNRNTSWHPVTIMNIQLGVFNLTDFLFPLDGWRQALMKSGLAGGLLILLGTGILAWVTVTGLKSLKDPVVGRTYVLAFVSALYIFGYLAAVFSSMSLFDASTKFQPRILSPVYVSLLTLAVALGAWLWSRRKPALQVLLAVLLPASLILSWVVQFQAVTAMRESAPGYASWKWRDSKVLAAVKDLPVDTIIYTNSPPAIYLITGRASRVIPSLVDPVDGQVRGGYQKSLDIFRKDMRTGAVLVLFDLQDSEEDLAGGNWNELIDGLAVSLKVGNDYIYVQEER